VRIKFQFVAKYPEESLVLEILSDTLEEDLVQKINTACKKEIAENAGGYQATAVVARARSFLEDKTLLICFNDILRLQELFPEKSWVKPNDKTGIIKMKMKSGKYFISVEFQVTKNYPDEAVTVTITKSNYGERITAYYRLQSSNLCLKLAQGINPLAMKKSEEKRDEVGDREMEVTTNRIHAIKDDVKYLKKMADLREQSDDKKMRRTLVRLNKKEAVKHEDIDKQEEEARRALSGLEIGQLVPIPSVFIVAEWLYTNLGKLAVSLCQGCGKRLLPDDPAKLAGMHENSKKVPEKPHCGHWFHTRCLQDFLTTPPFKKPCAVCGRRVTHPAYSTDVAKLEKAWAQEQAKKRELSEIADFMGF